VLDRYRNAGAVLPAAVSAFAARDGRVIDGVTAVVAILRNLRGL
jgi:hypothetical protein